MCIKSTQHVNTYNKRVDGVPGFDSLATIHTNRCKIRTRKGEIIMKKNITIDNKTFEVKRSKYASAYNLHRYANRSIYQCYDRPNTTKVEIYTIGKNGHT